MATKTVILRPFYIINTEFSDSAGSALPTFYPEDTDVTQAHLLISETSPDDDATYISVDTGNFSVPKAYIKVAFDFSGISDYSSIKDIRIICRAKVNVIDNNITLKICKINYEGDLPSIDYQDDTDDIGENHFSASNTWETLTMQYVESYSFNDLISYLNTISETLNKKELHLAVCGDGTVKANMTIGLTQMYLEVDYEGPNTSVYLKQNGTWEALDGTIYQKTNGSWVETDDSVFSDSDRYVLTEI